MTSAGSPPQRAAQASVRILVVDDHEVMRMGIRNLLESKAGWHVSAEASNGKEAIEKARQLPGPVCLLDMGEKARQETPDVIIMDITMPVMNGLDAARQIATQSPGIPIVMFSLHLSEDLIEHFKTDGIRAAVAKGDAARDLVRAVETVLTGGRFFPTRNRS